MKVYGIGRAYPVGHDSLGEGGDYPHGVLVSPVSAEECSVGATPAGEEGAGGGGEGGHNQITIK